MKQFGTILKFEFKSYLKNKIFVGVTVFLVLLIAGIMFFPRLTGSSDDTAQDDPASGVSQEQSNPEEVQNSSSDDDRPVLLLLADTQENEAPMQQAFTEAFPDYRVQISGDSLDQIKTAITSGEASCAFVFDSLDSYTYYVDNLSMYDFNTEIADELLQNL